MENFLSNPFVLLLIHSLTWGPPFWPEIGVGLSSVLLSLWLALRISRRQVEGEDEIAPPPPRVEIARDDTYEAAMEEMQAERAAIRPPSVEIHEALPVKVEIPEEAPQEVAEEEIAEEAAPLPPPVEEVQLVEEEPPAEDFLSRLKRGLKKTQEGFLGRIDALFRGAKKLDEDLFEELEEALVTADLGVETSYKLLEKIQQEGDRGTLKSPDAARELIRSEVTKILDKADAPLVISNHKPFVIMVLGVNGVGKTTTIAKLAYRYRKEGKKVLLAAGDTFRAAAIEQLGVWAKRVGVDIVKHAANADPSAVAFDALQAAKARGIDIVIVDTAGRLHTRVPLMEELKKVKRIIAREIEGAPHETLLVLDATTGQNAISQAQAFHEAVGVTGIVLTKLDGTAKGGVIVGISDKLKLPIRFIGIGEKMYDLAEFKAGPFVDALFSRN